MRGLQSDHKQLSLIAIENSLLHESSDDGLRAAVQPLVSKIRDESGGETFVAVMQAIDLRDGDDSSDPGWHDRARIRAILVE